MAGTEMQAYQPGVLAIRPGQDFWTDKQRAALAVLGIKNATNGDLAVFMHYCQKTGLDPFSKQIYMIQRAGRWTIQVGIDGFRVIRDRAARRDQVTVEYEDTRWYDTSGAAHEIWLRGEPPAGCGMAVLKDGKRFPAVLSFAEYVQIKDGSPSGKWAEAPAHQIEKCAEAFALRRAFPHDLGGIYIPEEMPAPEDAPPGNGRPYAARVTAQEIKGTQAAAAPPATGMAAGEGDGSTGPAAETTTGMQPGAAAGPPEIPPERSEEALRTLAQAAFEPDDRPGSITGRQLTKLHAIFSQLKFDSRTQRDKILAVAERMAGRVLAGPHKASDGSDRTTKNLSKNEASKIIDTLDGCDPELFGGYLKGEVGLDEL